MKSASQLSSSISQSLFLRIVPWFLYDSPALIHEEVCECLEFQSFIMCLLWSSSIYLTESGSIEGSIWVPSSGTSLEDIYIQDMRVYGSKQGDLCICFR